MADLINGEYKEKLESLCVYANTLLKAKNLNESTYSENLAVCEDAVKNLARYIQKTPTPFYSVVKNHKCVLEGAQGILLDIDHGSFPYVTSSNTLPAYAAVGTPFPMHSLGRVIGVAKAYLTRVGRGPMPSEQDNEVGENIRQRGGEFGATTGRPRRVGWLNLDELKLACELSDCTDIVMTKADILAGLSEVKVFVDNSWKTFPAWPTVIDGDKLHSNFESYLNFVEKVSGVRVLAVGTGAGRESIFWRHSSEDLWALK
jgi:adenylosuccinate synthase